MNTRKHRLEKAAKFFESDYKVTCPSAKYMSNGRIRAGLALVPPGILRTMVWACGQMVKAEEQKGSDG